MEDCGPVLINISPSNILPNLLLPERYPPNCQDSACINGLSG